MNVELKRIAEKKLEQMGGDVCGVLVRNEAGAYAAVDEHGRVMWLDSWVEGQVEPAGVSERELFEQRFPVPAGIYWNDISEQYDALPGAAGFDDVEIYHGQWMGWQAARTQSGQGVEPAAWGSKPSKPGRYVVRGFDSAGTEALVCVAENDGELVCNLHDSNSDPLESYSNLMSEISDRFEWVELHACPQPTQQGSVPDEAVNLARKWLGMTEGGFLHNDDITKMAGALVAAPQPEGDGWVGCEDRLPEQLNREYLVRVNSQIHSRPRMFVAEYNEYGFDRSKVTHWMPLPQPPAGQEGKGDEH